MNKALKTIGNAVKIVLCAIGGVIVIGIAAAVVGADDSEPSNHRTSDTIETVLHVSTVRVPADILREIKAKAADDFPSDYSTRAFVIKTQKEAYVAVQGFRWDSRVATADRQAITTDAYNDFGRKADFSTMHFVMKNQQEAYLEVN